MVTVVDPEFVGYGDPPGIDGTLRLPITGSEASSVASVEK